MFLGLHHQHGRAFAHHKPVAVVVKRTASPGGVVVALAERAHHVERRHDQRHDGGFGPAHDHHIRIAAAQNLKRLAAADVPLAQALTTA